MKLQLLKQTALALLLSCSLSFMTGCASSNTEVDIETMPVTPECLDETGATCVITTQSETSLYLPEFSSETYKAGGRDTFQTGTTSAKGSPLGKTGEKTAVDVESSMGGKNGTDLAFSRPASEKAISVKDKKKSPEKELAVIEMAEDVAPNGMTEEVKVTEKIKAIEEVKVTEETPSNVVSTPADDSNSGIKKVTKMDKKKTLADKVAYGEKCRDWEATAGETLRSLLIQWGEESGWTVIWKLDRDYNLEAGVVFRGTFTEVSGALIRSFARATPAPIGTFYKGNRVLVVNTQEDENAD